MDSSKPPTGLGVASDLKLVDPSKLFESPDIDSDSDSSPSPGGDDVRGWPAPPLWIVLATLAIGVAVIGWQAERSAELEAEVARLEVDIDRAHSLLEAHRSHLGEIRSGVDELSGHLERLRVVVDSGPIDAVAKSGTAGP